MNDEFRPLYLYVDGTQIAPNSRIRVQGRANMTLIPDFFTIDVYNISETDNTILRNGNIVYALAFDNSMICYGNVVDIYTHTAGGNEVTTIGIADGQKFWEAKVSKTINAGIGIKETIKSILEGVEFGSYLADNPRLIRGQTFCCQLPRIVQNMASAVNARAFVTHGALHIVGKGTRESAERIYDDDMLNTPSEAEGMTIVSVTVKGYAVGAMIIFENGLYRLVSQVIDADNFSGNWKMDLVLANEDMFETLGGW